MGGGSEGLNERARALGVKPGVERSRIPEGGVDQGADGNSIVNAKVTIKYPRRMSSFYSPLMIGVALSPCKRGSGGQKPVALVMELLLA
jgi:hypothetical protein